VRIHWNSIIIAAAVLVLLSMEFTLAGQAPQQGGQRGGRGANANLPPAGPTPRLPNGKPDLSGHWGNPYTPNMAGAGGANALDPATRMPFDWPHKNEPLPDAKGAPKTFDLPYTEWGLKEWKSYEPEKNGDYAGSCLPFGMARSINSPHGVQIIQNDGALAFLWEQNTWFHWVPTDPNFKWPPDLPPNWNGTSAGHWEGDTLVIETSGFNGYTRLDTIGHPHSADIKMINTFTRTDSRTIQHTFTVHDPKAYTRDWMNVRTWNIKPVNDVIMEYSCEENNLGLDDGTIVRWKYPKPE
jgi:hypothetical protein